MNIREKVLNYHPDQGALGLSDVMLPQVHSNIKSRYGGQIDTSTTIAQGLGIINIPIVSAGMDTVTGAQMAITIALQGGIGEIHRNNTPEDQALIAREVKDRLRVVEEDPPMLPESATIFDAKELLKKRKRGYVVIYPGMDYTRRFSGLVTPRDLEAREEDAPLSAVMTPKNRILSVPVETSLQQAVEFMRNERLEKVPMVDNDGLVIGMYSMKDNSLYQKNPNAALDSKGRLLVGAAIGIKEIDVRRAQLLEDAGVDVLFLDVANGDNDNIIWIMGELTDGDNSVKIPIIVGNYAPCSDEPTDGENVVFASDLGASGVKVGVGPGKVCKTRDIAGVGIPQWTAIFNARNILDKRNINIPLIADGGVRNPHDANVAISAGADAVMIGTAFAGTSDSPGKIIYVEGKPMKIVRGMASIDAFKDRMALGEVTTDPEVYQEAAEGEVTLVPFNGDTKAQIRKYVGGLRSGMSYTNSHTIKELQHSQVIRVTAGGANEHNRNLG